MARAKGGTRLETVDTAKGIPKVTGDPLTVQKAVRKVLHTFKRNDLGFLCKTVPLLALAKALDIEKSLIVLRSCPNH
jgi:hypothetical protein